MNSNLLDQLNQSPHTFFFLVVDDYLDIDLYDYLDRFHLIYAYHSPKIPQLKAANRPYFCLEEEGIILREKNTGLLLSRPEVISYITTHSQGSAAVIPFKPSSKIDFICRRQGWLKIANDAPLNRLLEDKIKFVDLCRQNDLPIIPSSVDRLTPETFSKYQQLYGPTLVIQTHFGWAGQSTFRAGSFQDISSKVTQGATVKFSPYLTGYSLLNNCCLTSSGLLQSPPALQYTGLPQFTTNEFSTVGRQWPSLAPDQVKNQIRHLTSGFSKLLMPLGYKGFFGLDFFVDAQSRVYLLECNPRLTASFAFYTRLELRASLTPLFFYHLAEFLNLDSSLTQSQIDTLFTNSAITGSELTPKDDHGRTINKINSYTAFTSTLNPITIPFDIIKNVQSQ